MQKENSCRNFAPNIFNKNKCQNCFKPRETHLLSDKDLSKAKPIYCGWLLLAPIGTDFNNPVHKSRKWQRRWFVLFEHGALRYALDDNANTLPQGTINMNNCSDVIHAESMTGQKHSLSINLTDMKYYIRGENREDTLGWYEALIVYPETMREEARIKKRKEKMMMKKRKSEVPAHVKASPVAPKVPAITSFSAPNTPMSKHDVPQSQKAKPPSNLPELQRSSRPSSMSSLGYGSPTSPSVRRGWGSMKESSVAQRHASASSATVRPSDFIRGSTPPAPYVDLTSPAKEPTKSPIPPVTNSHYSKDEKMDTSDVRGDPSYFSMDRKHAADRKTEVVEGQRQRTSDSVSSADSSLSSHGAPEAAEDRRKLKEQQADPSKTRRSSERQHVRKADQSNKENNDPGLSEAPVNPRFTPTGSVEATSTSPASPTTTTSTRDDDKRGRSISRRSTDKKQGTQTAEVSTSSSTMFLRRAKSLDRKAYESITISPDLLNLKKGWLSKRQDTEKETWTKYWFVLADQTLKYYKDSVAEDYAETDGEINLKNCKNVSELDIQQNYGFLIETTEGDYTLSAMTNGIRRNWINAILKAAKPPAHNRPDLTHTNNKTTEKREEVLKPEKVEKPGESEKEKVALEELSVTERAQRRRARIRDRRKQGRSRTYDFAEFRPLVVQSKEKEEKVEQKEAEVLSPDSETEIVRTRHRSGSSRRSRYKTMEMHDLLSSNKPHLEADGTDFKHGKHLKRSPSDTVKDVDNQWERFERLHLPLTHIKTNHSSATQESSVVVKALQAEVDSLKQQMEKNQQERMILYDDYSFGSSEDISHDHSDDPIVLRQQLEHQRIQIDNLKEELNTSTEKAREKEKELRECSMQLDISLSEVQLGESQLTKAQNELQIERKKREDAERDYERRAKAQVQQIEESEIRLKESESKLLDAKRKIRDMDRQANLQKDHKKEVENLQEQIKMLQQQAEDQEDEMTQLQEAYEERCQNQKQLEDSLSSARDMIESYEEQVNTLVANSKSAEKDDSEKIHLRREVDKLRKELKEYKTQESNLKIQCEKYEAQIQLNDECNQTLQEQLEDAMREKKTLKESMDAREKEVKSGRQEIKSLKETIEKLEVVFKNQGVNEQKMKQLQNLQQECKLFSDENKRLKEELHHEQIARQKETNQLKTKVHDVTAKLVVAEKQISEIEEVRTKTKSKKSAGSLKAKVTELEAEMDNTGQMLAARLTALENPQRSGSITDDSDGGGSSSSTSSLNEFNEKKIRNLESKLWKSESELKTAQNKLTEFENALHEARSSSLGKDSSSPNIQRVMQENRKTISDLESKISNYDKKCLSVRDCLNELHSKVVEVQSESQRENAIHVLPFLESVLVDTLQMLGGSPSSPKPLPKSPHTPETAASREASEKEVEKSTSAKLRILTERLKTTGGRLSPLSSPKLARPQSPLASPQSPPGLMSPTSKQQSSPSAFKPLKRPTDLKMGQVGLDRKLSKDERVKMFAEQLSIQAMVITEMAASLEKYQTQMSHDPSSPLYAKIYESLQELSSSDLKSDSNSNLLRHSDTLAEKLLLESRFMRELARVRESYLSSMKTSAPRSRSKSEASSSHKSTSKYGTIGGRPQNQATDLEQAAAHSVTHAHINYILEVYNDRIARLSRDAKDARHQADSFQRKLRDLVQACKTKDVEQVSRLAVEVDTGVTPAQRVEELPPWKQQVDYGTLHGAQASLTSLNLSLEASFFAELARDVSCMSTNVQNLVDVGTRLIELNGSLSKFLKPSEIGEHASTIAYEAISQAELIFLCQRIRKDYEDELAKMKSTVGQQTAHCDVLEAKLKEMEDGDAVRMQELTQEHKKKVERLMQQLSLVEKARVEMSEDMDAKLTKLGQKQQKDMEACTAKHKEETDSLQRELSNARAQLQQATQDYMNEVEKLKKSLAEIKKKHEKQAEEIKSQYERRLVEAKSDYEMKLDTAMKENYGKERKLKDDGKNALDETKRKYEKELRDMEKRRKQDIEKLEKMHEKELETLNTEKTMAIEKVKKEWKAKLDSEKKKLEEITEREREESVKQLRDLQETTVTFDEMNKKIEEVRQEYEETLLTREKLHEENLKHEKEVLTQKIREQVETEMKMNSSIPFADEDDGKTGDNISLASVASSVEGETKDALRSRILALEEQIESIGQQSYQAQLDEIKKLCDKSFAESEETHRKQLQELNHLHQLEIERLQEEKAREMEEDVLATKVALESLRKHHQEEIQHLKAQLSSTSGRGEETTLEIEQMKEQIQTLSEHYTKKCIELSKIQAKLEEAEEKLQAVDSNNQLLQERNNELAKKLESELDNLKKRSRNDLASSTNQENAGNLYQLQVKLRVKNSETALLKQEVEALKQQLETAVQDKKYSQQKHKSLFDEMTAAKSLEVKSQRDIARLREKIARLEANGDISEDGSLESADREPPKSAGYDVMKSKSHPDFPSFQDSTSRTFSASVKRRSSDRSSRSKSLKESTRDRS